jgi:hypothetical protein
MKKFFYSSSVIILMTVSTMIILVTNLTFSNLDAQCTVIGTGNTTGNVNYGSSNNWANPNRANLSDDLHARVQLANGEVSKYLEVSDYGYVIPVGATIDGIQVSVEGYQESFLADFADASIVLMKNGMPVGIDHAGTGYYDDKDYVNIYGSSTDLWGETWTPADIMNPGFGVLYAVKRNSGTGSFYMFVDYVEVTVFFSGNGCILPVNYESFNVSLQNNHSVRLDWTTSTETNNALFTIERSYDGAEFVSIGTLEGAGHSTSAKAYNFTDHQVLEGTAYYRLQQTDANGSSQYSEVRMVTADGLGEFSVTVFPNPAATEISIAGNTQGAMANIYDLTGKVMAVQNLDNGVTIDIADFPKGFYVLQVTNAHNSHSQRFLIQ